MFFVTKPQTDRQANKHHLIFLLVRIRTDVLPLNDREKLREVVYNTKITHVDYIITLNSLDNGKGVRVSSKQNYFQAV